MLFDSHAHYDDARFDDDRDAILRAMSQANVSHILNPGCDLETSRKAVEYANGYDFMYAAVGYHPESLHNGVNLQEIEKLARENPKVRAIGEIGLDYYWEKDVQKRQYQQEVFHAQMRLAEQLQLPVIIHDRQAHADSLAICMQYPNVKGVMHCYSGSAEMAKQLVALGYSLSFTGVITFKNAQKAREVIAMMPMERIMIETDAPYLAPEPFRGKRNSSQYVYRVAEEIAAIRHISVEEVQRITCENAKNFFNIQA